jgi:hypothetical protein
MTYCDYEMLHIAEKRAKDYADTAREVLDSGGSVLVRADWLRTDDFGATVIVIASGEMSEKNKKLLRALLEVEQKGI